MKLYDWFFLGGEGVFVPPREISKGPRYKYGMFQEGERETFCAIDSGKSCFTFFFYIYNT